MKAETERDNHAPSVMESGAPCSRAESTFTSETDRALATNPSVFKPWKPRGEGVMEMENEVHKREQ